MAAFPSIFSNILQSFSNALSPMEASQQRMLNPDLCQLCQSLTFKKLLSGFKVHANYGELLLRAFTCPLCRILLSALINQPSDHWWPDEEPVLTDAVSAKLIRGASELSKFPERLEVTVLRSQEEIEAIIKNEQFVQSPEIRLVKHAIICVDPSKEITKTRRVKNGC